MTQLSNRGRLLILLMLAIAAGVMLGCQPTTALPVGSQPRWACPSVTPVPTRIKESRPRPTTTPGVDSGTDDTYYQEWEQEYGVPIVTPTPYSRTGTSHLLGQRVEVWPLHVLVTATDGGALVGDKQLHILTVTWVNHDTAPIPMDYSARIKLRAIRQASGSILMSESWGMTGSALTAAGLPTPPDEIPVGESTVQVPILAPPGTTETVDIAFLATPTIAPTSAATTGPVPTPGPTAPAGIHDRGTPLVTVQWSKGQPNPPCNDPGTMTNWGDGPPTLDGVVAPEGTARVVQIALNQVGKPYVFGAKGPNQFDCSGLVAWSYAQIGITIPGSTGRYGGGQWQGLPATTLQTAGAGDLIFFDTLNAGTVTHVGLLAGDLNGDGKWDMVHAASPQYGIRVDYSVFERPYYASRYLGLRTVRR